MLQIVFDFICSAFLIASGFIMSAGALAVLYMCGVIIYIEMKERFEWRKRK